MIKKDKLKDKLLKYLGKAWLFFTARKAGRGSRSQTIMQSLLFGPQIKKARNISGHFAGVQRFFERTGRESRVSHRLSVSWALQHSHSLSLNTTAQSSSRVTTMCRTIVRESLSFCGLPTITVTTTVQQQHANTLKRIKHLMGGCTNTCVCVWLSYDKKNTVRQRWTCLDSFDL